MSATTNETLSPYCSTGHVHALVGGEATLSFGLFTLIPRRMLLLKTGERVHLGGRATALLITLTERSGEVFSNRELMERVWPRTHIDEANVRVHIAALRKALGDGQEGIRYIINVAGRGYCFIAPVDRAGASQHLDRGALVGLVRPLAPRLERVFGRSAIVDTLRKRIRKRRFISIIGPGGVGKTTVALQAAKAMEADHPDGTCFIDLAPLRTTAQVPVAVTSALGLPVASSDPVGILIAFLRGKRMLLILDNCEHVLDGSAKLAEVLLQAIDGLAVLATSREPLRAEGEWLVRLPSLELPPHAESILAAAAKTYSAVQLFCERAEAMDAGFAIDDENAVAVVELCRRLDGLPLAIELAAAQIGSIGLRALIAMIDDRFELLARGRRSAMSRQQTLRATLDWSYERLDDRDRALFECLSIFKGRFTLAAVTAVAAEAGYDANATAKSLSSLALKSLVETVRSSDSDAFRMLETTRAYAAGKLAENGGPTCFRRAHAEHLC